MRWGAGYVLNSWITLLQPVAGWALSGLLKWYPATTLRSGSICSHLPLLQKIMDLDIVIEPNWTHKLCVQLVHQNALFNYISAVLQHSAVVEPGGVRMIFIGHSFRPSDPTCLIPPGTTSRNTRLLECWMVYRSLFGNAVVNFQPATCYWYLGSVGRPQHTGSQLDFIPSSLSLHADPQAGPALFFREQRHYTIYIYAVFP